MLLNVVANHRRCLEKNKMTMEYCKNCKAELEPKKQFCIVCQTRVFHPTHYLKLKRVLNRAVKENPGLSSKVTDSMFIEVAYDGHVYHIKAKALVIYASNLYTNDTMVELQDAVITVKRYMKKANLG